jgi:SAM-dependent methyltransferase
VSSVSHPIFARFYAWFSRLMERELGEHRDELLAGLSGHVIEVGAGNGLNFDHYPAAVDLVSAVEPDPYLRDRARRAASPRVAVCEGVAEELPAGDGEYDAAVACLVLCSVSSPEAALAELRRVLRPGGQLRFLEHVRAEDRRRAALQTRADRSGVWPWFSGGCHCSRDTEAAIRAAGFEIEQVRSFQLGPSWTLTNPVVLGRARRAA